MIDKLHATSKVNVQKIQKKKTEETATRERLIVKTRPSASKQCDKTKNTFASALYFFLSFCLFCLFIFVLFASLHA